MQNSLRMLDQLKAEWQAVKAAGVGERFTQHHERYEQLDAPAWKALCFFLAIFALGMAVTLPFVTGYSVQALLFGALAFVLLPGESRMFASLLDRLEALLRGKPMPRRARPSTRLTTQLERAELERALREVPAQPPAAGAPPGSVRAVQPVPVTDRAEPRTVTRAQVVPRPRIAGTMKIWSAEQPASEDRPKLTIVMFPPRADR